MADYLFRSIPGIVFEPFFVCALIWCVLILPFFRKNNKILFRGIFVAVIMMTVWRLVLHHVVISARYSVILVYPLMAVSACLCIKISPFGIWIMKKCKMQSGIARICIRFFSTVAVVGLSIACLCNALRFNQYEDAYKKIGVDCSKYRERAGQYHIIEKEYNRIVWYGKLSKSKAKPMRLSNGNSILQVLSQTVESLKNSPGEHFFVFPFKKGETLPSAATLNLREYQGNWEILSRYFNSPRKNKEMILARYTPVCPNVTLWNKKVPAVDSKNICLSGNFEKQLAGKQLQNSMDYFSKLQIKEYSDDTERVLPYGWYPGIGRWNKNNPPDVRLTDIEPLEGKFSLAVDALSPRSVAVISNWKVYRKNCSYSLYVRAEGVEDCELKINAISRITPTKGHKTNLIDRFVLAPGKVYRFHGEILTEKFPSGWNDYLVQFFVRGKVVIDSVSLEPF